MTQSNLAPRELYRYEWRTDLFLHKYRKGLPLTLVGGGEAFLVYDKAVDDLITRRGNSRFTMKGFDGKSYALSNFAKTAEFGGGGGSGGGHEMTKLTECAQAVYAQARTLHRFSMALEYMPKPENLEVAYMIAKVDEPLVTIINDLPEDWKRSCILGAEALNERFNDRLYQFHRGSDWVIALESTFKKLNAKERIFSNLNKWSPSDIYMLTKVGAAMNFDNIESIAELNKVLVDAFHSRDILGISLKLLNGKATVSYHNIGEDEKLLELKGVSIGRTGFFASKDAIVYFGDDQKIQFRTFPETFQGEIKGKNANHGKIGYGPIQTILKTLGLPALTPYKEVKQMITDGDVSFFEEFHFMYQTHNVDYEDFTIDRFKEKCQAKGAAWLFSKFLSLQLVNTIVKSGRGNEFVTSCIRYASSSSEHSAPFVKLE